MSTGEQERLTSLGRPIPFLCSPQTGEFSPGYTHISSGFLCENFWRADFLCKKSFTCTRSHSKRHYLCKVSIRSFAPVQDTINYCLPVQDAIHLCRVADTLLPHPSPPTPFPSEFGLRCVEYNTSRKSRCHSEPPDPNCQLQDTTGLQLAIQRFSQNSGNVGFRILNFVSACYGCKRLDFHNLRREI